MMFLYYREGGEIVAISPVEEKIEDTLVTKVTVDSVLSFIDGSKDSNQYRVMVCDGAIGFKKKDIIKRDNLRRSHFLFCSITDDSEFDLEITTYIKRKQVSVRLHQKHRVSDALETGTVYGYRYIPFHYVIGGDPHFLVKSITVSFSDLLSGDLVFYDVDTDVSFCDIFVKNPFVVVHRFKEFE